MKKIREFWEFITRYLRRKWVRQVFYVSILLLSLAFIAYAIAANWTELRSQEWHIKWIYLILAVVLYPVGMLPTVAAWHWLLVAMGVHESFKVNLRIYALSSLPRHIPGLVWYVTSRTLLYQEAGVNPGIVLGATASETVLLALSGFIMATLYIGMGTGIFEHLATLRLVILLAVLALAVILIFAPGGTKRLGELLRRLQKGEQVAVEINQKALWLCLGWMFAAWAGGGILLWLLTRAITPISLELLPVMMGIWGAAGAVSLTIGVGIQGMGLREVTLGAMLSAVISPLIAVVVAVAFRLALTVGEFLWVSLIAAAIKPIKKKRGAFAAFLREDSPKV
jgi:hypothetical protein